MSDTVHHVSTLSLSTEQKARVDAVRVAHEVSAKRASMSASWQVDVVDLIAVAQFILSGRDPFEAMESDEVDETVDLTTRLKARASEVTVIRDGD